MRETSSSAHPLLIDGSHHPVVLEEGESRTTELVVEGRRYQRIVVGTEWLHPGCDVGRTMTDALAEHLRPGDLAIVSEKVVVITTGRCRPAADTIPGYLARTLAARVHPIGNSRGLSIPAKMQSWSTRWVDRACPWRRRPPPLPAPWA